MVNVENQSRNSQNIEIFRLFSWVLSLYIWIGQKNQSS